MSRERTGPADQPLKGQLEKIRRHIVADAVERHGNDRRAAAQCLSISYNTLWRIMADNPVAED